MGPELSTASFISGQRPGFLTSYTSKHIVALLSNTLQRCSPPSKHRPRREIHLTPAWISKDRNSYRLGGLARFETNETDFFRRLWLPILSLPPTTSTESQGTGSQSGPSTICTRPTRSSLSVSQTWCRPIISTIHPHRSTVVAWDPT